MSDDKIVAVNYNTTVLDNDDIREEEYENNTDKTKNNNEIEVSDFDINTKKNWKKKSQSNFYIDSQEIINHGLFS